MDYFSDYSCCRRKRATCEHLHRIGPAPREEIDLSEERKEGPKIKECSIEVGSLDGDLQNFADKRKLTAASRTLLIYFAKMASNTNKEKVDYQFLSTLFQSGAHVNVCDRYGQTVMHEVARNWSTDLAKFLIQNGADVNKADEWGRTPLHVAASVNHHEMVEYILCNGGNPSAKTIGEEQTPLHFAAKFNAVSSLKVLIDNKVNYNCRDYKQRTPLFLAADMAQEDTTRYLLDLGVPVGVFDDTGMSAIALMIEKMPHIAIDGLNQFQHIDIAFRKKSFYLNYLESNPKLYQLDETEGEGEGFLPDEKEFKRMKKEKKRIKRLECPTTALEIAVKHCEHQVIMHPVVQELIRTKWNLFGKLACLLEFVIHLIFCIIWTVMGILLPRDGNFYDEDIYWRLPVELFGVLLTVFFILKQIWVSKISYHEAKKFRVWRSRQLNRDMDFCHPRWTQEKTYLEHEIKNIVTPTTGLFEDPWNIMEFLTYGSVLVAIATRIIHVMKRDITADNVVHERAYSFSLIFLWFHFMKSCRAFTNMGLFIALLGYVVKETIIFAMLCVEISVPYMVGFWILFGGERHAKTMESQNEKSVDWKELPDLMFSVWQVTLVSGLNFSAIIAVDKLMAQNVFALTHQKIWQKANLIEGEIVIGFAIMVGTFYALCSMVCINVHIALLTEKFREVYENAKAHTSRLQATTVLHYEKLLSKERLAKMHEYLQKSCAPLVLPADDDIPAVNTTKEFSLRMTRTVFSKLDLFKEMFFDDKTNYNDTNDELSSIEENILYQGLDQRNKELFLLHKDIYDMKCALLRLIDRRIPLPPKPQYTPLPVLALKREDTSKVSRSASIKVYTPKRYQSDSNVTQRTNSSLSHLSYTKDIRGSKNCSELTDVTSSIFSRSISQPNSIESSSISTIFTQTDIDSSQQLFFSNNSTPNTSNDFKGRNLNDYQNARRFSFPTSFGEVASSSKDATKYNTYSDRSSYRECSNRHSLNNILSSFGKPDVSNVDTSIESKVKKTQQGLSEGNSRNNNRHVHKDTPPPTPSDNNDIFQTIMKRKSLIIEEEEEFEALDEILLQNEDDESDLINDDEEEEDEDSESDAIEEVQIPDLSTIPSQRSSVYSSISDLERSKKVLSIILDEDEIKDSADGSDFESIELDSAEMTTTSN